MLLLDTNIVSELRRLPERQDTIFGRWFRSHATEQMLVSVVTFLELERGILLLERRDPRQANIIRSWVEGRFRPAFEQRALVVDATVARRAAQLHVPNPRPQHDALIAATALVHGLTVVTRDVKDYAPMGVPLLNPWEWVQ